MRRSFIIRFLAVAVSLNLAACGTLMDPYVSPKRTADGKSWHPKLPYEDNASLPDARAYAGAYAQTYRAAAADHTMAKNTLGVGLIALNTIGLIKGATTPADGSDLLPIIGFGSAGALNIGGLLISSPRQAVYLQGQQSMLCARSRTDGYVVITDKEVEELVHPTRGLDIRRTELRQAVEQAKAARAASLPPESAPAARQEALVRSAWLKDLIDEANLLLALAEPVAQDLVGYDVRRRGAALRLYADVGLVAAATDRQVQRTEPDVGDIRNALSKTSLASTLELPAPKPAQESGTPKAQGGATRNPRPKAPTASDLDLEARVEQMRQMLPDATLGRDRLLAAEQTATSNENCVAAGLLLIEPVSAPADALVAGNGELLIPIKLKAIPSVPVRAPMLTVVGSPAGITAQLIVVDESERSYQARLQAGANATPGAYTLLVTADEVRSVPFTVTADPTSQAEAPRDAGGKTGQSQQSTTENPDET